MKSKLFFIFFCATFICKAQVPSYVPLSGLKAWYNFSTFNDNSNNGNHLSVLGNTPTLTTDRFGTANNALSFASSSFGRLVRTVPNFQFNYQQDFTISTWLSTNTIDGVCLFSGNGDADNFITMIALSNPNVLFGANMQGQSWILTPSAFTANQWEHIVGVYSSGFLKIYKNGILINNLLFDHIPNSSVLPFYIGGDYNEGSYSGKIDDVGIWDRALTPTEIVALYTSTLSNDSFSQQDIILFPNPVNNIINLKIPNNKVIDKVWINDVLGKKVFEQNSSSESLNVSHLQSGIYFILVQSGDNILSKKFTKK